MQKINDLIAGYKRFHQRYFVRHHSVYRQLIKDQQTPKIAIIACSDSRVDPSLLMNARLGELFVIRNVANLVPPYEPKHDSHHGTSAALEFAVNNLNVEHVIVFGHSKCAGIRALMEDTYAHTPSFINSWIGLAQPAKQEVLKHTHASEREQHQHCERKAIEHSLSNLMTFPWIAERVKQQTLRLHGWHFEFDGAELWSLDEQKSWQRLV